MKVTTATRTVECRRLTGCHVDVRRPARSRLEQQPRQGREWLAGGAGKIDETRSVKVIACLQAFFIRQARALGVADTPFTRRVDLTKWGLAVLTRLGPFGSSCSVKTVPASAGRNQARGPATRSLHGLRRSLARPFRPTIGAPTQSRRPGAGGRHRQASRDVPRAGVQLRGARSDRHSL